MTVSTATAERRKNIENIYPLSPMQEGLLFHSVMTPEAGLYTPQVVLHMAGEIDGAALAAAWAAALRRHPVLRSGFHWEERDQPFQVVYRDAPLSWTALDWSALGEEVQAARLSELLAANRAEAFDLRRPPLLRLHLVQRGEGRHCLVICYHHLILDGWSAGQLIREAFQLYLRETGAPIPTPPPPRPYADYIAWLKRQDRDAAETFWRGYLDGATPTWFLGDAGGASGFGRYEHDVPPPSVAAMKRLCQRLGLTLSTLLQGALGLLIARATAGSDVIFGATSAGRPATLDGATAMIGLFINTLPVRVRIDPAQSLGAWLVALQASQASTEQHGHLPLREIQGEAGALFDCLLVVESYPVSTDLGGEAAFRLTGVEFDEWTHYPLTLMTAADGEGLRLTARYARAAVDEAAVAAHLQTLVELLETMAGSPQATLQDFVGDRLQRPPELRPSRSPASEPRRTDYIAPSTETEKLLATAWAEVLKRPEPGIGDNFFELGGHSLLAARVISRIRRALGMELAVRTLFDRPVLGDLAAYIDALRASSGPAADHIEIEI